MSISTSTVSIHPYFKIHPGKMDEVIGSLPAFVEKTAPRETLLDEIHERWQRDRGPRFNGAREVLGFTDQQGLEDATRVGLRKLGQRLSQ